MGVQPTRIEAAMTPAQAALEPFSRWECSLRDRGPGDLFVIRVAGNTVAPSQIGSGEFELFEAGS